MATKAEADALPAKIRHPRCERVFIERQMHGADHYRYIAHTGINRFVPDLYHTQALAIAAVDAKLAADDESADGYCGASPDAARRVMEKRSSATLDKYMGVFELAYQSSMEFHSGTEPYIARRCGLKAVLDAMNVS